MLSFLLVAALSAQTAADPIPEDASVDEVIEQLSTAPKEKKISIRSNKCTCTDEQSRSDLILEGLVVDAELTLAPGGRSVNERRATIINVSKKNDINAKGRTKIWHLNSPKLCGVSFTYGKTYKLALRKTEDGQLETDACLMKGLME